MMFKKKENPLDLRIAELETLAYTSPIGLTEEDLEELLALEEIRQSRKTDPRVKVAILGAIGSIGAALIGALALVYRVKRITKYEEDDYAVTSAARNERL